MHLLSLLPLFPGPKAFHCRDVNCGSCGHNIRLGVDGECLDSARPVTGVQS